MATIESVITSKVSIAAPPAAPSSAAAYAAASAGAPPARARSCSAARIAVGCRLRAGAASMPRSALSDWHPDDSSHWNDNPTFTWRESPEEILDRLAGHCRSLNK